MARILINIHSQQTIQNYIAISEVKPDMVISFYTKEYSSQVAVFKRITGLQHEPILIDAYDFDSNFKIIEKLLNELDPSSEIIINYTGGTKIMSVSVVLKVILSVKQKLTFLYINTFGKKTEYLHLTEDQTIISSSSTISTVVFLKTYVDLKNERIKSYENTPSDKIKRRFSLSEYLLVSSDVIQLFSKQKSFFEKLGNGSIPKSEHHLKTSRLELRWNQASMSLITKYEKFVLPFNDGGLFFTGAWLEEYVFYKLVISNIFDEVLANVKFDFTSFELDSKPNSNKIFKNEIDVVATKGIKTFFIECKAGFVSQDYVYKLKAIRDHFLGTFGEAILVTKFPQKEHIIEKCKDLGINLISSFEINNIDNSINDLIV